MKKKIAFIVFVLMAIGLGFIFFILSQPPKDKLSKEFKEQELEKILGRKAQLEAKEVVKGNKVYNGKYITFEYPARAIIFKYPDSNSGTKNALEDFMFDIKSPKMYCAFQVLSNDAKLASVDDIPGVRLRESQPALYKAETVNVDGIKGKAFVKKREGGERTVFFIANNRIYSFAITGPDFEALNDLSRQILASTKIK